MTESLRQPARLAPRTSTEKTFSAAEQIGLLEGLDPSLLERLHRLVTEERLPPGATLFKEGDPGDCLYLVRSGLVEVVAETANGEPERLGMVGPGESVGEISLLTGEPRTATARARTGVSLWRLGHTEFIELLVSEPVIGQAVSRIVSGRLRRATRMHAGKPAGQIVTVWAAHEAVRLRVLKALASGCDGFHHERVGIVVSPAWTGDPPGCAEVVSCPESDVAQSANRLAREHPLVFASAPPTACQSLFLCSDRIVVVTPPGGADPTPEMRDRERDRVIRLHPTASRRELDAVARGLAGRRVGVALGVGGIRGFVHSGVLATLEKHRIPIDVMTGASAGAIVGALYLAGRSPDDIASVARIIADATKQALPSFGFAPGSVFSGRRLRGFLRDALGDRRFEDLPIPFAVSATDLDTHEEVVIDSGPLAEAVMASAALPGIFPPVELGGRRLGDGGMTDPVPVRPLRERGADVAIAVNVFGVGDAAYRRWRPFRIFSALESLFVVPALAEALFTTMDSVFSQLGVANCRQADVVISPRIDTIHAWDITVMKRLRDAGARATREAMPQIGALLMPAKGVA